MSYASLLFETGEEISLSWPNLTAYAILGSIGLTAALLALRGKLISNAVMKVMLADKDRQIDRLQKAVDSKERTLELQAQLLLNAQEMTKTATHVLAAIPEAAQSVEAVHDQ